MVTTFRRRRWLKRSIVAAGAAALVAGAVAAYAARHHGACFGSGGDIAQCRTLFVDRAAERLALDTAQQQRLAQLFDAAVAQRSAFMAGADPRSALRGLVAGPRFDRDAAAVLVAEKTDAVKAGSPALITAAADFYDGLSAEQQGRLRQLMERRRRE